MDRKKELGGEQRPSRASLTSLVDISGKTLDSTDPPRPRHDMRRLSLSYRNAHETQFSRYSQEEDSTVLVEKKADQTPAPTFSLVGKASIKTEPVKEPVKSEISYKLDPAREVSYKLQDLERSHSDATMESMTRVPARASLFGYASLAPITKFTISSSPHHLNRRNTVSGPLVSIASAENSLVTSTKSVVNSSSPRLLNATFETSSCRKLSSNPLPSLYVSSLNSLPIRSSAEEKLFEKPSSPVEKVKRSTADFILIDSDDSEVFDDSEDEILELGSVQDLVQSSPAPIVIPSAISSENGKGQAPFTPPPPPPLELTTMDKFCFANALISTNVSLQQEALDFEERLRELQAEQKESIQGERWAFSQWRLLTGLRSRPTDSKHGPK
jgi:hypothetical protein